MSEKSVIEVELFSGEVAYVTPLSPFTYQALRDAASEEYPDIDTTPFQKPVPDSPPELGLTVLDEKNPELTRLRVDLQEKRMAYIRKAAYDLNVCFELERTALIKKYEAYLHGLAKYVTLPDDQWEATFTHALISRLDDQLILDRMLFGNTALEGGEIQNGMRVFRPKVQGT